MKKAVLAAIAASTVASVGLSSADGASWFRCDVHGQHTVRGVRVSEAATTFQRGPTPCYVVAVVVDAAAKDLVKKGDIAGDRLRLVEYGGRLRGDWGSWAYTTHSLGSNTYYAQAIDNSPGAPRGTLVRFTLRVNWAKAL